ncbi:dimethylallyltransferase [Kitasatospora xanthocidica]|uniref:type 1 glutamine amidotransferase domain-containing protein n=1 Tax=Kitasatospora xanthocidica TaxID=83382 RepID=UPI00167924E3|nr:type 1 glutamine amidotransferase domain-containing protein [Kitasatospora xanthocidica]GHF60090.1 dimethylallyltransferase [Kitasatospora xanthocidica]
MADILFVLTGTDVWTLNDGTKHPTGFWAEEAVVPYQALTAAGHRVTVATPGGVVPVADRASLTDPAIAAALEEIAEFRQPLVLAEVDPADYDAVFYPGGHGPMEDLAVDADSGRLLTKALASGRPLGVVCHGPAALLAARTEDGGSPFAGYRLTGFTNAEETQAGLADRAPWLLQDRLVALGADFQEGEPWAPHSVVDRNLVTGQNPASSALVATGLLELLKA